MKRVAHPRVAAATLLACAALALALATIHAQQPDDALNLIVVVDVTASRHKCPEGVAGIPSTTVAVGAMSVSSPRQYIPPAVEYFVLKGVKPNDRVRLAAMAATARLSPPLSGSSPDIPNTWANVFSLPPVDWLGPSPIWDQLFDLIGVVASEPGRRSIVLVTDGQATGNIHTAAEVAALAREHAVRIAVIGEPQVLEIYPPKTLLQATGRDPHEALKHVAEASGGTFVAAKVQDANLGCFTRNSGPLVTDAIEKLRRR